MALAKPLLPKHYEVNHEFEPGPDGHFPAFIVAKFDYFTCMYYDCKVSDLLQFYDLHRFMTEDLKKIYEDRYVRDDNIGAYLIFNILKGITIEVPTQCLWYQLQSIDQKTLTFSEWLETEFSSIRFNCSGEGLEYLRQCGFDVETRLFMPTSFFDMNGKRFFNSPNGCKCALKRIDLAFDFLNFHADLYQMYADCFMEYGDKFNARMFTGTDIKCNKPRDFSLRSGKERTVYCGSSACLLRLYDKMHQWNRSRKKDLSKFPYITVNGELPSTWTRIELQMRNEYAEELLLTMNGDFTRALQYYFMKFAPCSEKNVVYEPFGRAFDWNFIDLIIQKINCAIPALTLNDKLRIAVMRNFKSLYLLMAYNNGHVDDELRLTVNDEFLHLQRSSAPEDIRRVYSIKRYCLDDDNNLPPFVYIGHDSLWHLTFIEEVTL